MIMFNGLYIFHFFYDTCHAHYHSCLFCLFTRIYITMIHLLDFIGASLDYIIFIVLLCHITVSLCSYFAIFYCF